MAVVAISRMVGALGDEIAEMLAKRLDYRLVAGQELVRRISSDAGEVGIKPTWSRRLEIEERPPSFSERFRIEPSSYLRTLRNLALELAVEDCVVIVGLGVGQALVGLRQVLRVLIVAPNEVRLNRLATRYARGTAPGALSRRQVRKLLRQHDGHKSSYMRYVFGIDWLDPLHWDLTLNTGQFTVAESVTLLTSLIDSGLLSPRQADTWCLADRLLAKRVETALAACADIRVHELEVEVQAGKTRVGGIVPTQTDWEAADAITHSVAGVRCVDNQLRVHVPFMII